MVLVRPTVILAAVRSEVPSRAELPLYGMQLVGKGNLWWAEKAAWFRNVPYTAIYPTIGQLEVRIHFGRLAKEAKERGEVGTREKPAYSDRLGRYFVGAAAYIADNMKGFKAPHALPEERRPSKIRKTFRTLAEREAELETKVRATAPAR